MRLLNKTVLNFRRSWFDKDSDAPILGTMSSYPLFVGESCFLILHEGWPLKAGLPITNDLLNLSDLCSR